mgnify:CR=1 FL=1
MPFRSAHALAVAVSAVATAAALPAGASVIIDNATSGYMNTALGDLAEDSTLGNQTDTATGEKLFPAANVAEGDPTIPPVATEPDLANADPGTQTAFGNFLGNTNALGGNWSSSPMAVPSSWAVNDETAIVYEFDPGTPRRAALSIEIGVDNGIFVWLNGDYLTGALAPGGAFPAEYTASAQVGPGTNYLQILREDHGGSTGYDIQVTATAVPMPASLGLLGAGLIALGAVTRPRQTPASPPNLNRR